MVFLALVELQGSHEERLAPCAQRRNSSLCHSGEWAPCAEGAVHWPPWPGPGTSYSRWSVD